MQIFQRNYLFFTARRACIASAYSLTRLCDYTTNYYLPLTSGDSIRLCGYTFKQLIIYIIVNYVLTFKVTGVNNLTCRYYKCNKDIKLIIKLIKI